MNKNALVVTVTLASLLPIPSRAFGDELAELTDQIQQIQAENNALREQVARQGALIEQLGQRLKTVESQQAAAPEVTEPIGQPLAQPGPLAGVDIPQINLRGFGDIGFTTRLNDAENTNSFELGSIDLFMTSELTDRVSALVEANFVSTTENAVSLSFQRALIKYLLSDWLKITVAGRMHTPLGYWNQTYHHGAWLQTTIFRPEIYLFEANDGGFLPVHNVGIDVSGIREFDAFDVEYNLGVFNGRGRTVTELAHLRDKNDSKAFNVLLGLRPHALEGLKIGADLYLDEIPGNPPTASRLQSIDERILGGYAAYVTERVELLGELFDIFHDDKTSGREFETLGFYVQGGYKVNDQVTPYYRFDFMDVANGDPFFTAPRNLDRSKHTFGLRWDPLSWNAIKLEYSFTDIKRQDDEHTIAVNTSFAF